MYRYLQGGDPVPILNWFFKSANSVENINKNKVPTKKQKAIC